MFGLLLLPHSCRRNLNHLATSAASGGGLELYEAEQAAALKAARPEVSVMVLRNTQAISVFWDAARSAMMDPDLWLQSPPGSGRPMAAEWGSDSKDSGGPTLKFYLNYSEPKV